MYDLDADEFYRVVTKNSANLFVAVQFSYLQLQLGEEYFEASARGLGYNWQKIRREILLQWTNSTTDSPIDPDDLHDITMNKQEPIGELIINRFYSMKLYKDFDANQKVLIAVDPSKGVGRDATAVVVIDVSTDEIIAVFSSSKMSYPELQRFLETLIAEQFINSTVVIENNIGKSILAYMLETPFKHHIYGEIKDTITEVRYNDGSIQNQKTKRMDFGMGTTSKTRPLMFDMLLNIVATRKKLLTPDVIVNEIATLQYKSNTRIEHALKPGAVALKNVS